MGEGDIGCFCGVGFVMFNRNLLNNLACDTKATTLRDRLRNGFNSEAVDCIGRAVGALISTPAVLT
jgi:hypothetical protein